MMYKKLLVVGDVGAGKSTVIKTLSQIETVDTDVTSSVDIGKKLTTVGIDYGRINLGDNMAIGLYGVPGQKRFSFVWDMVKENLWGCVILLNASESNHIETLGFLLDYFIYDSDTPLVVGITHADEVNKYDLAAAREQLQQRQLNAPVFTVDARKQNSAILLVHTIVGLNNANDTLAD